MIPLHKKDIRFEIISKSPNKSRSNEKLLLKSLVRTLLCTRAIKLFFANKFMISLFLTTASSAPETCLTIESNERHYLNPVSGSVFIRNGNFQKLTSDIGGALNIVGNVQIIIENSRYSSCRADSNSNGQAGAIYINTRKFAVLREVCCLNCTARSSCNCLYLSTNVNEKKGSFYNLNNFFGTYYPTPDVSYVVYTNFGDQYFEGCNFSQNNVYCGIGPAIRSASSLKILTNTIYNSTSMFKGLEINIHKPLQINRIMFISNEITTYDALLSVDHSTVEIFESTFFDNHVYFSISNSNGNVAVYNCYCDILDVSGAVSFSTSPIYTENYVIQYQEAQSCFFQANKRLSIKFGDYEQGKSCFDQFSRYPSPTQ